MPIEEVVELSNKINSFMSPEEAEFYISRAAEIYELLNFNLSKGPYFRARTCESLNGYALKSEISYTPEEITKPGRLNDENRPFLYLSRTLNTALLEVDAKDGDIIQIGYFEEKVGSTIRLGLIGEFLRASRGGGCITPEVQQHISKILNKISQKDQSAANSYIFLDSLFDDIITDPNAKEKNYIHSRILTRSLINNNNHLDGILYHSNKNKHSYNIAIPSKKSDEKMDLTYSVIIKIKKRYKYGLFDIDIINKSKNINQNREIEWIHHK